MCDINPVHHLFATGTSEVSAIAGCACAWVCVRARARERERVNVCLNIKLNSDSLVRFQGGLKPTVNLRMSLLIKKLSNMYFFKVSKICHVFIIFLFPNGQLDQLRTFLFIFDYRFFFFFKGCCRWTRSVTNLLFPLVFVFLPHPLWRLLCLTTRGELSAGTLVFGTEWGPWTAPWAASPRGQSMQHPAAVNPGDGRHLLLMQSFNSLCLCVPTESRVCPPLAPSSSTAHSPWQWAPAQDR